MVVWFAACVACSLWLAACCLKPAARSLRPVASWPRAQHSAARISTTQYSSAQHSTPQHTSAHFRTVLHSAAPYWDYWHASFFRCRGFFCCALRAPGSLERKGCARARTSLSLSLSYMVSCSLFATACLCSKLASMCSSHPRPLPARAMF